MRRIKRLGTNEKRVPAVSRQEAACDSQERAIPAQVHGALYLAAKDRHLVANHEILKLDLLGGAILGAKDAEQSTTRPVEECGEHGRDSARHGRLGASGAREIGPEGHDRVFAPDERGNFSESCFSLMPWFTAASVKAPPRSGSITSPEKAIKVLMSNSCA
jgi:hypothetical protein